MQCSRHGEARRAAVARSSGLRRDWENLVDNAHACYGGGRVELTVCDGIRQKPFIVEDTDGYSGIRARSVFEPYVGLEASRDAKHGAKRTGMRSPARSRRGHGGDVALNRRGRRPQGDLKFRARWKPQLNAARCAGNRGEPRTPGACCALLAIARCRGQRRRRRSKAAERSVEAAGPDGDDRAALARGAPPRSGRGPSPGEFIAHLQDADTQRLLKLETASQGPPLGDARAPAQALMEDQCAAFARPHDQEDAGTRSPWPWMSYAKGWRRWKTSRCSHSQLSSLLSERAPPQPAGRRAAAPEYRPPTLYRAAAGFSSCQRHG